MSDDEKAAQIGRAVQEYQDAKVNLAHLDNKAGLIAGAYQVFSTLLKEASPFNIEYLKSGHLKHLDGGSIAQTNYLMDEKTLVAFLTEKEQAKKRLKAADESMKALGITNLS